MLDFICEMKLVVNSWFCCSSTYTSNGIYEYACYCSTLTVDLLKLHELYKQRPTSETWTEQVKNQLLAAATLTDDFHTNDIL